MVDFFLIKSRKNKKFGLKRPIANLKLKEYEFILEDIYINCLSFDDEEYFKYEDEDNVFLLLGDAYNSGEANNKFERITAKTIAMHSEYLANPEKWLRGLFIITKIDKKSGKITVINDIFGLKPLYYGALDNSYFITTSLSLLSAFDFSLNEAVLFEKIIFYHSLSEETVIENIYALEPASKLVLHNDFKIKEYFNWKEFLLSAGDAHFSISEYIETFNNIIQKRAHHDDINLVTLTGGHDGRAVLSAFIKNNLKFETYSFGRKGSENTYIPELISERMNFNHSSIYLEGDFEKDYFQNGLETIWLTDGELSFDQQTTLYGAKQLASRYSKNFTGLLAGEILGPVHLITDYLNPIYYQNIYLKNNFDFKKSLNYLGIGSFIENEPSKLNLEKIKSDVSDRISKNTSMFPDKLSHLVTIYDLIQFGFRKFYGSQIHLARYYLNNNPVFYNFDLLKLLIQSDFHLTYKNSFKSKFSRRESRFVQCSIIQHNSKELARLPLDRGYSPYWTLHPVLKYFRVFPYYRRKNRLIKGEIPPDFISPVWTKGIYNQDVFNLLSPSHFYDSKEIEKYLENIQHNVDKYRFEANRIISQFLFVHHILKK